MPVLGCVPTRYKTYCESIKNKEHLAFCTDFHLPRPDPKTFDKMCRSLVPLGQVKSGFNFDTTDRRVLNFEYSVTDDDNIKQDISIDVYGRKEVEQLHESNTNSKSQNNTPADEGDEDDDALDSLLSA